MSAGLPSDEVAEDYKNSLEDLVINSRYEISNLTIIAKENTEHAMAISRVLENHIRSTPPDRKLPAMYVLDSIVKNVGTPYTLFLGRNLYHTFMNAYTLVNNQIRRKLDEMLKTWKEPVPGSLDTKPVFPPDVTRPIENALIKARTAAVQQQQYSQQRSQQEMMGHGRSLPNQGLGWRNTPTPPQMNGQFRPPGQTQTPQNFPPKIFPQQNMPNQQFQPHSPYPQYSQHQPPQPTPTPYQPQFQQPPPPSSPYPQYQPPNSELQSLNKDLDNLIRKARDEFAANIEDFSIQTRLKALLDLQGLMQQQQLPPHEIQMIRDQVNALSRPAPHLPNPISSPYNFTPQPAPVLPPQLPPQAPPQQQNFASTPDLSSLLSTSNLAEIIAKAQGATPTPLLQTSQTIANTSQGLPLKPPAVNQTSSGSDLMASLRAAGLIPSNAQTPTNGLLPFGTPPPASTRPGQNAPRIDVELKSASLKVPRPQLIKLLYDDRPNQCTTCGKRFLATDKGREKKARHLDWHFRTNQRLVDAAKRSQNRSWYVDELEWIKSRDDPESSVQNNASSTLGIDLTSSKSSAIDPKTKYIPVPSDPGLASLPCPICQEKFDTVWSDEAQDFVWMDAIRVGGRIYHASCHNDVKRDGASTPLGAGRIGTPDSILGKRKATDG